ncbi:hypothetical protein M569_13280 [Genlisea aurea]|uniref:Uncharacterized protein n=1 Tax=Genlisea aurea TaxID=192259 RepID=S8C4D1_9LAMI|nr:hypothetical protein M569_13280 [Genlisea aurea]
MEELRHETSRLIRQLRKLSRQCAKQAAANRKLMAEMKDEFPQEVMARLESLNPENNP